MTDSIWSTLMSNLTLLFPSLPLTNKIEHTFGKLSILAEPRQLREKKYLKGYQFAINQDYQKRTKFW